jgi:hypothetical protein
MAKAVKWLQDTVIFEPAEEGGYVVVAPAFGGASPKGKLWRRHESERRKP